MEQRRDISAYRNELKGLAILWIVFFHTRLGLENSVIGWFQGQGFAGVDGFFFLSGFGLYHSLQKSNDLGGYTRRRLERLLPAYLPFCLLWLAVMLPVFQLSTVETLRTVLGNLLMIGYMAGVPEVISWYPAALMTSIIAAPFAFALLHNAKRPRRAWLGVIILSLAAGGCYLLDERLIVISRLPIFFIGMGFAIDPPQPENKALKGLAYGLSLAGGLALLWLGNVKYPSLLSDEGLYWYPYALLTAPLCAGLGFCFRKLNRLSRFLAPLRYLGRASFEIFLFNVWAEYWVKKVLRLNDPAACLGWALGSVAAGCLYHELIQWLKRRKRYAVQK